MDLLFAQPYCRIANLDTAGIAKRQTASKYLRALAQAGVLQELELGKEKLFVHPKLMGLLTRDGNDWARYGPDVDGAASGGRRPFGRDRSF